MKKILPLLTGLVLMLPSMKSFSDESVEKSWWDKALTWLEETRDEATTSYLSMSESIDKYFYGKELENTSNRSHLKLEFQNSFYKAGETKQDIHLRAKLDLPNTKNRFKLVFDSDPDEEKSLEERLQNDASGERIHQGSSTAGVEYSPDRKPLEWKSRLTGGIKLRIPLLPFAKYELEKQWILPDQWGSEFEQTFWYYDDDGFGETSQIRFYRPITENYQLQISSEIEFRDMEDTFFYNLILSTIHRLNDTSSISYYTGALGESQPTNQFSNYVIGANYRKLLYEDWLFFTIDPALSFPRAEDWHGQPSLTLGLQIYFADSRLQARY